MLRKRAACRRIDFGAWRDERNVVLSHERSKMNMGKIIGIDLGTTNSAFAYLVAGKPEVITNAEGNRTTPSVVAVNKNGERLVGQVAQRQRVTNPKTLFTALSA